MTKLTDESIKPASGATIPLSIKLTDANGNPAQNKAVDFVVMEGPATVAPSRVNTDGNGIASADMTLTAAAANSSIKIKASYNASVNVVFSFSSSIPAATVNQLWERVNQNGSKITDQVLEVSITETEDGSTTVSRNKIWQKDELLKIEDLDTGEIILPEPVCRAVQSGGTANERIISYDSASQTYIIETRSPSQTERLSYFRVTIDYGKGVVTKLESHTDDRWGESVCITEFADSVSVSTPAGQSVWVYGRKIEKGFSQGAEIYSFTTQVTNRRLNVGLTDADF